MSDSDFVDIGDELVVKISGYPVATAYVYRVDDEGVHTSFEYEELGIDFVLPLDVKSYDQVDGVAHETMGGRPEAPA
jgi:hypothetical protein